jgi:hypothetical protein
MHTKGPAAQHHDGSNLRIGIVHARWNDTIIDPLLAGTRAKLLECGVKESNIVVQSVPGSWELPIAVQRCVLTPLHFLLLFMIIFSGLLFFCLVARIIQLQGRRRPPFPPHTR